jgi:hypothetical protein
MKELTKAEMVHDHNELVRKYNELSFQYEYLKETLREIVEATNEGYSYRDCGGDK